MIEINNKIIAAATDCSFDSDISTKEGASYKLGDGAHKNYYAESFSWAVTTDHLVVDNAGYTDLLKIQTDHVDDPLKGSTPVRLIEAELNSEGQIVKKSSGLNIGGNGIITKLSFKAANGDEVKLSISIQGTGKMTQSA